MRGMSVAEYRDLMRQRSFSPRYLMETLWMRLFNLSLHNIVHHFGWRALCSLTLRSVYFRIRYITRKPSTPQ